MRKASKCEKQLYILNGFDFATIKKCAIITKMYTSDTFIEASIKRNNGIKGVVYIILLIIIALLILAAIYAVPIVIGFYELLYVTCDPACVAECDRVMKITDGILKHMIVKNDEE